MKISKYELDGLEGVFDIFDVKTKKINKSKVDYETYDISTTFSPVSMVGISYNTETVYELTVSEHFVYLLIKLLKHDLFRNNEPSIVHLYGYMRETWDKEEETKKLHAEYPELEEIMRDYNVTKNLIIKNHKK